jgi:hypothetical protein
LRLWSEGVCAGRELVFDDWARSRDSQGGEFGDVPGDGMRRRCRVFAFVSTTLALPTLGRISKKKEKVITNGQVKIIKLGKNQI